MPDSSGQLAIRTVDSVAAIGEEAWDRCAGTSNPFVSYAFLNALEESDSVNARTGWLPQHAALEDENGTVLGAVPMYLKNHSQGEYVFDHGWADAYERAGGSYYPKLQVSVPFTPVTGPRLLVPEGPTQEAVQRALTGALIQVAEKLEISNLHITFPSPNDMEVLKDIGLLVRRGFQYHWKNDGYESFDDFLAALASRKRKSIRKERREVKEAGIEVRPITGDELTSEVWDTFYRFYHDTYDRKWGYPYLTRPFFEMITEKMADQVVLMWAVKDEIPVAAALNFMGDDALYGRNWGCAVDFKFLHFETCYYRAIEFAIDNKLSRVEAGTQGPHKVQRGYLPVETYSAHWIADSGFRTAVADFVKREGDAVEQEMHIMMRHSPFRQENGPS